MNVQYSNNGWASSTSAQANLASSIHFPERQHLNTTRASLQSKVVSGKLNIYFRRSGDAFRRLLRKDLGLKLSYSSSQSPVYEALFRSL